MLYLGVDGGGTKTRLLVLSHTGTVIAATSAGPLNQYTVGLSAAVANLACAISSLPAPIAAAAIGNPALDDSPDDPARDAFLAALRETHVLPETTPIYMKSDVFMALYALTAGAPGVLVIAGTGSMSAAFDRTGALHVAGGWGHPTADPGSAYDIASRALSYVFDASDGIEASPALTAVALSHFNVNSPRSLIAILNDPACTKDAVAAFAKDVDALAADGDPHACHVLDTAADSLIRYAAALRRKVGEDCPVGLYGGVFQHSTRVRERFTQRFVELYPNSPAAPLTTPPEMGAARYAMNKSQEEY
ncbi:MAG: N-acetylglucosamine kinase [Eubacteriales bacterium]|jgi:glucosamine kinase